MWICIEDVPELDFPLFNKCFGRGLHFYAVIKCRNEDKNTTKAAFSCKKNAQRERSARSWKSHSYSWYKL